MFMLQIFTMIQHGFSWQPRRLSRYVRLHSVPFHFTLMGIHSKNNMISNGSFILTNIVELTNNL